MTEGPSSYANLAGFLAAYASTVADLDDVSIIGTLAAEVKIAAVRALLIGRDPTILNSDLDGDEVLDNAEQFVMFLELLNGVALEVQAVVGTDPQPPVRELAVWTITVGVAAAIDAAMTPEQMPNGTDGAAEQLRMRYLALLKRLEGATGTGGDGALSVAKPVGEFPCPLPYPDPAEPSTRPDYAWYYGLG